MTKSRPGIISTLTTSVGDAIAFCLQAPVVALLTAAAFMSLRASDAIVAAHFGSTSLMAPLWIIPQSAADAALATPIMLLISRRIVLWEGPSLSFLVGRPELVTETFFAIWLTLALLFAPALFLTPLEPPEDNLVLSGLWIVAFFGAVFWMATAAVRFLSYATSVAVEDGGASLRSAWVGSRGWAWKTIGLVIPLWLVLLAAEIWWLPEEGQTPHPLAIYAAFMGFVDVIGVAVFSALAAHVYMWRRTESAAAAPA